MKNLRIIPRLDIKGPNLVKGIHMEGLRVLGKPEDFAELIVASIKLPRRAMLKGASLWSTNP